MPSLPINFDSGQVELDMPITQTYSWQDIENLVKYISPAIETYIDCLYNEIGVESCHIVPVSRGGNIPATILSHHLQLPIKYSVHVNSYTQRKQSDVVFYQTPKIDSDLHGAIFVEDIIDTGATVKKLLETYPQAAFLSLIGKPLGYHAVKDNLITPPPIIVNDSIWVQFPWERVNKPNSY